MEYSFLFPQIEASRGGRHGRQIAKNNNKEGHVLLLHAPYIEQARPRETVLNPENPQESYPWRAYGRAAYHVYHQTHTSMPRD